MPFLNEVSVVYAAECIQCVRSPYVRIIPAVFKLKELHDILYINNPAKTPLNVFSRGGVFHALPHLAYLPDHLRMPPPGVDTVYYCLHNLPSKTFVTHYPPGLCKGLLLPKTRIVAVILLKILQRSHQYAASALWSKSCVHLVQRAPLGNFSQDLHQSV